MEESGTPRLPPLATPRSAGLSPATTPRKHTGLRPPPCNHRADISYAGTTPPPNLLLTSTEWGKATDPRTTHELAMRLRQSEAALLQAKAAKTQVVNKMAVLMEMLASANADRGALLHRVEELEAGRSDAAHVDEETLRRVVVERDRLQATVALMEGELKAARQALHDALGGGPDPAALNGELAAMRGRVREAEERALEAQHRAGGAEEARRRAALADARLAEARAESKAPASLPAPSCSRAEAPQALAERVAALERLNDAAARAAAGTASGSGPGAAPAVALAAELLARYRSIRACAADSPAFREEMRGRTRRPSASTPPRRPPAAPPPPPPPPSRPAPRPAAPHPAPSPPCLT
eukprot:tig00020943_g16336.t1